MNPLDLAASELLIWGIFLHLVADWLLQNDWMANNKQSPLHPAAWVHAGIHGILFALIFGWVAFPLTIAHLLIDTRKPVVWWARFIRQTPSTVFMVTNPNTGGRVALMDMGTMVRIWVDQVFHIFCVGIAALLVTL
jgi:hypothetical protein